MNIPKNWAIILAAGKSSRLGGNTAKQFLIWKGQPLYWHSAQAFARSGCVAGIVFVFPAQNLPVEEERLCDWQKRGEPGLLWKVCAGGERRQDSVANGLALVPLNCEKIFVHDAARPFLSPRLINRINDASLTDCAGALPALPVTDTIKMTIPGDSWVVERTLARERLMAVQTPQVFKADLLRLAHASRYMDVTDDASMLENLGYKICLVPGEETNIKITRSGDLELLKEQEMPRPCNGFGYDVHKFGPGRPLVLGGVEIPGKWEVLAHSDGDVLLHALIDALLGCAGLGDIGSHFPDSNPEFAGISSAILLDQTLELIKSRGVRLNNADITIIAQKPRLEAWKEEIRRNVARLLNLDPEYINIKATTEEGLGFTGNLEGIKACAIVNASRS